MTGSRFAASKELPVKTPSDAIAQLLDKMSASVGGDMETVIEVCLDASWRVVDRTDTIPHAAVKWFKTMNEDIAAEVSAKFSDGIANAKGIDAPEQITKLDFYDPHYEVPVGMDEIYSYLQSWKTPLGASIWESTAVGDLQATGSVIAEHHHSEQPEDIVLPLYIYSASQIGSRVIWCANMDDRNWELLDGERFEEAFKSGDTFELKRSMFPDLSGNLIRSDCAMVKVPSHPSDDVQAFQTLTSSDEHVTIVRYEHSKRGDSLLGPYSDTVSWLPFPSIEHQFQVPLTSMPSSGILEYLYSRGAEETVSWHPEWSSRFALGQAIEMLIKVLFAVTDQQTFDLKMYRHFTILIESLLGTPEERRKREDDMKQVLVEMVSEGASDSSSLGHAASVSAIRLFIGSGQFISELAFPPAVVKKLINAKLGSNPEPSPALLAHSLEIQELRWCGKKYLLSLSGERKYLITENGELAEVFRTNNPFPDQVFWLLNAAMRHKQFQTPTKLEVYSARHRGDYVYCPNTKEWTMNGVAAVHKEGEWSVNGDILEKNQYWLQMGSFMVPQVTPLIYWLDRALRAIDEKCEKPQTYRGLKNVTLPKEVYDKDKVVLWSAYSSSTSDRGVASSFAKDDGQAAIFALHGNTCVCISPWSRFSRERELLFPPNSTFLISASLDETQQEILGVANLQLFSMKEVDRYGAMVVYLRKVVNHVISTVQAAMVPVHVRQLFKIMRCFEKHDLDGALEHTCDPDEPVLGTPEGVALARMLIDIGADPGVRTKVAMRSQDASVESLSQLVMAGGSWADAFEWVLMYEKQNREAIDSLCTFLGDSILKHEGLLVSEQSEFEMLLSGVWDRVATSDSEHFVPQVTVTGLKGKASYLNGLYARLDANSAAKMGLHPEKTFAKVATRVNSWAHISYNEHHDCWFLDDAYMKECRQTRGEASEAVAFMWPPPFRARPVNMCLLGKWMDGFCVIFSKPAVPKDKQVAWTDQDLASFEGLDEDVDSGTVERFKANGPQQCSEDSRVKLNRHSAKPWWNGGTNFKIQTTIHEQDLVELRLGNSVRRLVSHSYGRGFAMGIAHDKRKTYARTPGRVEQSVNLSRGELPFNKHLAEGWEAFQLLLTDEKHREITEKIKKRVSLLEGRVPPNDCCSNIKTSFSTPAKYERRARLRTDETTCPSALEIVDGIGCGLYKMKSELCYETEAGFKFFKKDEESKWLLKVPESVVDYQMLLNATVEAVNDNELKTYLEETEAQKTEAIKALRSWDGDLCCSFSSQRTGLLSRNIVELLDICRLDNKEDTDAEDYSDVVRMFQDDAEATIKSMCCA